jgi:hypothetical protein
MKRPNFPLFALIALACSSCATSIPVLVRKPAEIDLTGIRRIAVLPFGYGGQDEARSPLEAALFRFSGRYHYRSDLERRVATEIANGMNDILLGSRSFSVISGTELVSRSRSGAMSSDLVDAYVTGDVGLLSVTDKDGYKDSVDKDGVVVSKYYVDRGVELEFTYRVIRASDGAILGQMRKSGRASDSGSAEVKSEFALAKKIIDEVLPSVAKEIAPYSVTEYRTLEADKTKDQRMKDADDLVKKGRYEAALAVYEEVFAENGNFAAGYDAAIVTEILGDPDGAILLMDGLAARTGASKAASELARMRRTKADAERLEASRR